MILTFAILAAFALVAYRLAHRSRERKFLRRAEDPGTFYLTYVRAQRVGPWHVASTLQPSHSLTCCGRLIRPDEFCKVSGTFRLRVLQRPDTAEVCLECVRKPTLHPALQRAGNGS